MGWFKRKSVKVVLGVVVVAGLVGAGVAFTDDSDKTIRITAIFDSASPVIPGNTVRASGVRVGLVESVSLTNGKAAIEMRVGSEVLPLHKDASIKVRPVTLLGERYLQLNPGTPSAPVMGAQKVIKNKHTTKSVDLNQVLNSLDDPTGTALAALATTLGEGVAGQGVKVDEALKALAPAMRNAEKLSGVLKKQNDVLSQLVDRAAPVAKAIVGKKGNKLDSAVQSATAMLHAVAVQHEALRGAIRHLPETLQKAQRALAQVAGVADSAVPVLRSAQPVTENLTQITKELDAFARTAQPALGSLPSVLRKAEKLIDQARPAVRDLRPGAEALPGISQSVHRLVGKLTPNMKVVLDFIRNWAMSTNGTDALGNYFRAFVVTTPQSLLQIPGVGLPGTKGAGKSAKNGGKKDDGQGSDLPLPAPGGPNLGKNNSATGLTRGQELALVEQLLGGQ